MSQTSFAFYRKIKEPASRRSETGSVIRQGEWESMSDQNNYNIIMVPNVLGCRDIK